MAAKRRSVVWSFFQDDLNSKRATCQLCADDILHCGNTTNLLKHLRSKHQGELTDAAKRSRFCNPTRDSGPERQPESPLAMGADIIEVRNDAGNMSETGDQQTEQEAFEGNEAIGQTIRDGINGALTLSVTKSRKRSAVWRYFQDGFDPNRVLCLVCSENIHYPQNTSNLIRHLRKKHPAEYGDIEGCLKERPGAKAAAMAVRSLAEQDLPNGDVESEEVIQVSIIADELEEQERMNDTSIVDKAFSLAVQPSKRRSAVWSYYERGEDRTKALCLLCSEQIHYRQNTSNLLRHLRKKHPDKDIAAKRNKLTEEMRAPPGLVAPLTLEQAEQIRQTLDHSEQVRRTREHSEQMKKALQQETRALERERELTEQLRRAQQQEAKALEQQRELTEQLRRVQEEEIRRLRELEKQALEQERRAVEQLRKTQEVEAKAIEQERAALQQLRRELEEDRRSLRRQWAAVQQGRGPVPGEEGHNHPGVETQDLELLVAT